MRHSPNDSRRASRPLFASRLRRLLIALAIGLPLSAAFAPAARACGMRSFDLGTIPTFHEEDPLLAQARRHLERGEGLSAALRAAAILRKAYPDTQSAAEALAIIGWVRWQRGQRAGALDAFARSRNLYRGAVNLVLAHVRDKATERAVRQALTV